MSAPDHVVNALRQPSRDVAFPGQPEGDAVDFASELEQLAGMCDVIGGFVRNGKVTHSPEIWAVCLRAKVKQIRDALQSH